MKGIVKSSLVLMLLACISFGAEMKLGYVVSARIMEEYSEVKTAQQKLEAFKVELEKEATEKKKKMAEIVQQLQAQKLMMSDEKRKELENEYLKLENEYNMFLQKNFGQQGAVYVKNNELMAPLMNAIETAVNKVAKDNGFSMIFDSSIGLLYGNPAFDVTDKVLSVLNSGK